jgi:AraC family L-rhamnose operon transcriptional activator RhaR
MLWREQGNPECGVQVMRLDPHPDVGPHDHLFLEIAMVERGDALHGTAAGTQAIRGGQIMVIRPQVWHSYHQCRNLAVTNCLISSPLLHQLLPLLDRIPGADALLRRRGRRPAEETPVVLTPSRGLFSSLREILRHMLAEQQSRGEAWQTANIGQLLQLLALLLRGRAGAQARATDTGEQPTPLSQRTAIAVQQAAAILERDFMRDLSLDNLAQTVGISSPHLSRSFKRKMGMGLVDYCHHLRIEEACRLLRLTDSPVSAIAGRVGYAEIAYFSRCFRRCMGQSPIEYRRGKEHGTGK